MGVKGSEGDLHQGEAVWAGAEALWSTLALPLVVCACLDDPQWAGAMALPHSAADLREAAGYPADDRRRRFLQRRAVLRSLAGRALGGAAAQVVIAHDAQGAPRIVAPAGRLHVSVAGRGALAAFGLSRQPIGVDLEPVGAVVEPAWNILHASERAWLEGLAAGERHRAFLQIWTVKEAYLKMLGPGLRIEPASVAVRIGAGGAALISRSASYPIANSSTFACPAPCEEGLGRGVDASLRSRVYPHPRQSSLRSSTPQEGGETQAMQRAAHVPEAPSGAEWRLLTLGGTLAYVAVATQGASAKD